VRWEKHGLTRPLPERPIPASSLPPLTRRCIPRSFPDPIRQVSREPLIKLSGTARHGDDGGGDDDDGGDIDDDGAAAAGGRGAAAPPRPHDALTTASGIRHCAKTPTRLVAQPRA
jgi:hypothetical protein